MRTLALLCVLCLLPQTSTQCAVGYTGPDSGPCTACPVGKFKNGAGSSTECTYCPTGTYAQGTEVGTAYVQCPIHGSCVRDCVSNVYKRSGSISDGSRTSNYADNSNCRWIIVSDYLISISFSNFDTESPWDYVSIRMCLDMTSDYCYILFESSGHNQGNFGGSVYTTNALYKIMMIIFSSDDSINGVGFEADWKVYTSDTGYMQLRLTSDEVVKELSRNGH